MGNDDETTMVWTPWVVAPGFEVASPDGTIDLRQIDKSTFVVPTNFRFVDERVLDDIRQKLRKVHPDDAAEQMLQDAREFPALAESTDLASVPRFLTWFESRYGKHTLAAIIHDRLILSGDPNLGALQSDTLSDRFFRTMMRAAGVPVLKSWIMWAAVAMRTRWAARGKRRWSLVLWVILATAGIVMFAAYAGTLLLGWVDPFGISPGVLLGVSVVMPFASAALWGEQYGASLVAAVAAMWILPPALLGLVGFGVYLALEGLFRIIVRN